MRALVDATVAISACATTYSAIMGPSGCLYPDDPNAVAPSDNYSMDAFSLELEPGMKKEKSARYAKGTKAFMRGQNISGKSEVVGLNEASLSPEQESDLIGRVIERRKNHKKKDKNPKRKDSGPFNLTSDLSETDDDASIESYTCDGEPNIEGDYLEGTPVEASQLPEVEQSTGVENYLKNKYKECSFMDQQKKFTDKSEVKLVRVTPPGVKSGSRTLARCGLANFVCTCASGPWVLCVTTIKQKNFKEGFWKIHCIKLDRNMYVCFRAVKVNEQELAIDKLETCIFPAIESLRIGLRMH
jgi:hypothetical protein